MNENKTVLKTTTFISPNKNKFILNDMCYTSKNIYNSCIFTNNIMEYFKNKVYMKVYNLFITNNEKIKLYKKNYNNLILHYYKKYYNFYINNIDLIKNNNNIIYNHIKNKLNNIVLNSVNIKY